MVDAMPKCPTLTNFMLVGDPGRVFVCFLGGVVLQIDAGQGSAAPCLPGATATWRADA
jgi:hypothetical protein